MPKETFPVAKSGGFHAKNHTHTHTRRTAHHSTQVPESSFRRQLPASTRRFRTAQLLVTSEAFFLRAPSKTPQLMGFLKMRDPFLDGFKGTPKGNQLPSFEKSAPCAWVPVAGQELVEVPLASGTWLWQTHLSPRKRGGIAPQISSHVQTALHRPMLSWVLQKFWSVSNRREVYKRQKG